MNTYDPAANVFSFLGNLITGYGPDTFITVERNEDGFSLSVGAGGEATRSLNRNRSGRITLTLMAGSQSNDVLSALARQDELFGTAVGPAYLKELNGGTAVSAPNCWIAKMPNVERAKESGTVEWVFESDMIDVLIAGLQ